MKTIFRLFSVLLVAFAAFVNASAVHAKELCPAGFEALCQIKLDENSGGIIGAIISIFLIIAILVSLFFIIFGAYRWITSAGDQNKVGQARSTIIAAVVGLVISLSVFFIINLVLYIFTGKGLDGLIVDFKLV